MRRCRVHWDVRVPRRLSKRGMRIVPPAGPPTHNNLKRAREAYVMRRTPIVAGFYVHAASHRALQYLVRAGV